LQVRSLLLHGFRLNPLFDTHLIMKHEMQTGLLKLLFGGDAGSLNTCSMSRTNDFDLLYRREKVSPCCGMPYIRVLSQAAK
jgi:hypothetical protein